MSLQSSLEKFHAKVVSNAWLILSTAILRGWLAMGFIIPGMKKVANIPFAAGIPTSKPIGYFFDAFFQASEFYIFVGIVQVLAGILLLFPATTAIGAVFYLPIILNIFFITVALLLIPLKISLVKIFFPIGPFKRLCIIIIVIFYIAHQGFNPLLI